MNEYVTEMVNKIKIILIILFFFSTSFNSSIKLILDKIKNIITNFKKINFCNLQ